MKRILVATMNPGKLREFTAALTPAHLEVFGLDALDRPCAEVEETGDTFEENALLKAQAYSLCTSMHVLADDSGLVVDALDGAPGVLSARYGGPGLTDTDRNARLLASLRDVPDERRTARFCCSLALAHEGTTLAVFEGTVEGVLLREPRGTHGFGYDPLFFHPPSGCTTAELTTEAKQQISHRGAAIAAFLDAWLRELTVPGSGW